MARRFAGFLALAAGLLVAAPATAQNGREAPTVTNAVQVTADTNPARGYSSPQIAVNPRTGDLVIVATDVRAKKTCDVFVSTNQGRTWSPGGNPMPDPYTDCSGYAINGPYFTMTFHPDGTLYLAFVANDPEFNALARSARPRHVFLATSTDSGRSFETRMVYEAPEGVPGKTNNRRPMVAVDPSDPDRAYVAWMQGPAPEEKPLALISATADGGRTWTEPVDLSDDRGGYQPRPAVTPDGVVHVAMPSAAFPTPFEDPRPLYYFRSTDHGRTWTEQVEIDPGNVNFFAGRKWLLAADPSSGALYTTWYGSPEVEFDEHGDDTDVFVRASTDGGRTWTDRRVVNDDAAREHVNHYDPGIAIAPNGRVDVAWYDFRNSPYPERFPEGFRPPFNHDGYQDVYYSWSTDQGATWSDDVRVTDRIINREIGVWSNNIHSHYNVGVASTDDAVYFAWQDTRNGSEEQQSEDIYFASALWSEPAVPATGPNIVWAAIGAGAALAAGGVVLLVGTRLTRRREPEPLAQPGTA